MSDTDALERARTALDGHAWADAYEAFASLDRGGVLAAEDLEGAWRGRPGPAG